MEANQPDPEDPMRDDIERPEVLDDDDEGEHLDETIMDPSIPVESETYVEAELRRML